MIQFKKTLGLLDSFKKKLFHAKEDKEKRTDTTDQSAEISEVADANSLWTHKLELTEEIKQKVIDANVADNERWDIYDPRNPLNKRKREEGKNLNYDKKRTTNSSRS